MAFEPRADVFNANYALLWEPLKSVQTRIEAAIILGQANALEELPQLVPAERAKFLSVLTQPPCNHDHREHIRQHATSTGIRTTAGGSNPYRVTEDFVRDTLKVSDALQLDEFRAAELVLRADIQLPTFPNTPRACVAVCLFYDGQQSLASSLHHLVRITSGRSWHSMLPPNLAARFNNQMIDLMVQHQLFYHIMDRLSNFNVADKIGALEKAGLTSDNAKFRRMLSKSIYEIEALLCETVFYWCSQQPVSGERATELLNLISAKCQTTRTGYLNRPGLVLLTGLLNVLSAHTLTEANADPMACCLFRHPDMADRLFRVMEERQEFKTPAVKPIVKLAIRTALHGIEVAYTHNGEIPAQIQQLLPDNSKELDTIIKDKVFRHMVELIGPPQCTVHTDLFFMSAWHNLITDIIVKQQPRMRFLRMQGEHNGRLSVMYQNEHGVNPPEGDESFQHLLEFLSLLYLDSDGMRTATFATPLIEEFWSQETTANTHGRPTPRLIALYNFAILQREFTGAMPGNLYIPYCQMLATICQSHKAASVCYNVLRNQQGPATVTFDHIFNMLHIIHQKLRTDDVSKGQGAQLNAHEVRGLCAALDLIAALIRHAEHARAALADHPNYNAVVLFVALLGCSLPIQFKASCVDVLTAFASTPDGALRVWQLMEAAKLVPTTTYVNVHPQPGMQMDLEEAESRAGFYPVTIAFLRLLDTLTNRPLPIIVGGPVFKSGFDPYMNYLRDSVFLKFLNRSYNRPEERWIVASLCLKVMEKVLRKFSCVSDNVLFNDSTTLIVKNTTENGAYLAYNLLGHLMQNGPLLRLILKIIVEGIFVVDSDENVPEQKELETAILLALRIIQQALIQQENFLCEVRNSNSALIVSQLDVLLKGVNPRTNRADYCASFGKIVGYFEELPQQALAAARILLLLTRKSALAEHLAKAFTMTTNEEFTAILNGFVGALDLPAYEEPPPGKESDWSENQLRTAIAQTILRIIQQCLEHHSVPNVAHLLLGFSLTRPLSETQLQPPGVYGTQKNCLHNTVLLLQLAAEMPATFSASLIELCFKLVYQVCYNVHTSKATIHYIRSATNFFQRHLDCFPTVHGDSGGGMLASKILMQQCWLLKVIAIDLRLSAEHNVGHMRKIVRVLVNDEGAVDGMQRPLRRKLLSILDEIIKVSIPTVKAPYFVHFDKAEVDRLLQGCHYSENPDGPVLVDISALHDYLALEKITEAVNISGSVEALNREIAEIIKTAVLTNAKNRFEYARKTCLNAWRQVAGTIVVASTTEALGGEAKMRFLLEVSTELLALINDPLKCGDSVTQLSEVVLINMRALAELIKYFGSHSRIFEEDESNANGIGATIEVNAYAGQLLDIVRSLLDALMRHPISKQLARSNLYASLLNILKIAKVPNDEEITGARRSVGERALNTNDAHEKLQRSTTDKINSYGDTFREVVCRDVCSGHTVIRMVALSLIDDVLSTDYTGAWLDYISRKGYLTHLIESLVQDDREMVTLLERGGGDDKPILLFVSKVNVLQRVSKCERGARMLLDSGLINKLTELGSFQRRPANPTQGVLTGAVLSNSRSELYQKMFAPVMQLLCAISSAVKCNNQDCISQLQNFLMAHSDIFIVILQQRHNDDVSESALTEMAYTCKVVARAGSHLVGDVHQGRMHRMHETMLAILPWAIELNINVKLETIRLEIIESILHSCADLLAPTIYDRKACYLLFGPNIMAASDTPQRYNVGQRGQEPISPLRLGLLVYSLTTFVQNLQRATEQKKNKFQKLEKVNELTAVELKEMLPEDTRNVPLSTSLQKSIVRDFLANEVKMLNCQVGLMASIIEQMIYILWRHLEFYLLHYIPPHETTLEQLTRSGGDHRGSLIPGKGVGPAITSEEIEAMRASLRTVFTDSYFRRLNQAQLIIENEKLSTQKFIDPSVRRLKDLTR